MYTQQNTTTKRKINSRTIPKKIWNSNYRCIKSKKIMHFHPYPKKEEFGKGCRFEMATLKAKDHPKKNRKDRNRRDSPNNYASKILINICNYTKITSKVCKFH